ncbi:MAG: hypothetical protein Q8T09_01870 [Candidatus Melainabacteria bacterium]|nr:hypothetical protein [Candidatus Melainabacteria bacterium]
MQEGYGSPSDYRYAERHSNWPRDDSRGYNNGSRFRSPEESDGYIFHSIFDQPESAAEILRISAQLDFAQRPMRGDLHTYGVSNLSILLGIKPEQFNQVARSLQKTNAPLGLSDLPQVKVVYGKSGNAEEIVFSAGLLDSKAKCARVLDLGPVDLCTERSWVRVRAPR